MSRKTEKICHITCDSAVRCHTVEL